MASAAPPAEERLEALLGLGTPGPRKRMLIIVNPYATTVSDRLKKLVVYALRGTYEVTAIDTQARGHATELCREAARQDYDVVVAFGGDGTVNEAANGLAGSSTALTCLPGGRTNVYCRVVGIPVDLVDATEQLLRLADDWRPRRVDLGYAGSRRFLFSAGVGLDASVVEQVDSHPQLKTRLGEWYYTAIALRIFHRRYIVHPPGLEAETDTQRVRGVSAFVQNGPAYTYFGERAVLIGQEATVDSGELCAAVLKRANPVDLPTIAWRALSRRARLDRHRQMEVMPNLRTLRVRSLDGRKLPLQVDGDYIGEVGEVEFGVIPQGLRLIS
ncbi:MAG TPA: diacylglycerol kinase family protein [Solirubrobacteraceae bacterium]|nr:diacylglycerol kinase family protein [Solirubrobacteraceae bacterium]